MIRLLFLLLLAGCATRPHTVEHRQVAGRTVEIHTDAPADQEPPGTVCREPWAGCYVPWLDKIYLRSPVAPRDKEHEIAHADGMWHTPWADYGPSFAPMRCALVTAAGGRYKVGQMICKRRGGRGEEVFTDSTFSELVKE